MGKTRGVDAPGVGVPVAWAVAVGVVVGCEIVTMAPATGRPLKSSGWPLLPLALVILKL